MSAANKIGLGVSDRMQLYRQELHANYAADVHLRMCIFDAAFDELGDEAGWTLLGEYWNCAVTGQNLLPRLLEVWRTTAIPKIRRWFMTEKEREAYAALPVRIGVWQGYANGSPDMMLWTTQISQARKDAAMCAQFAEMNHVFCSPRLCRAVVRKSGVFAMKLQHEEPQLIVIPGHFAGNPTGEISIDGDSVDWDSGAERQNSKSKAADDLAQH